MLIRSPLLTSHKRRKLVSSGRLVFRCYGVFLWCYLCFVLLRLCLYAFVEPAALRSTVLQYAGAPIATRVFCFLFFPFCLFGDAAFSEYFLYIAVLSLYGDYVVRFFLPDGVFYLVTTGWIFYINLCENSIKKKKSIGGGYYFTSPSLDPNTATGLDQWPENMPLRVQPMMQEELTDAIRSLANGKAVGPDGVSVELFKITLNGDPARLQRLVDIAVCIWRGIPQ